MSSSLKVSEPFDLSIFKENDGDDGVDDEIEDCEAMKDGHDALSKCIRLKRLLCSLKYYQILDTIQNEEHQDIFIHFMTSIYCDFLDHYTHLIQHHQHQIEDIHKALNNNGANLKRLILQKELSAHFMAPYGDRYKKSKSICGTELIHDQLGINKPLYIGVIFIPIQAEIVY